MFFCGFNWLKEVTVPKKKQEKSHMVPYQVNMEPENNIEFLSKKFSNNIIVV